MRAFTFALVFTACASPPPETLDDYVRSRGLNPADCDGLNVGQCGSWTPSEDERAAVQCFKDAFARCESARFRMTLPTEEGDPISYDMLVVTTDAGCAIVQSIDTRADNWGPQEVTRYRCQTLATSDGCGGIVFPGQCEEE